MKLLTLPITHGNLTPDQGFILFIVLTLLSLVTYAIYVSFGSGKMELRDTISEHARLHDLGIAHKHD